MNKEIRVFISSTFNDMHPERDYLVKRTFPRLRHMGAKRGVTLTEVDLRWGITEAESKEGKTLGICLDEIINSRPFFIGLLGNRYGWTPAPDELGPEAIPERYDWISKDLSEGMSITELEMQFGVLRNPQKIYANFYIRTGGVDDDSKQTRLKEAIRHQDRYKAVDYSDPEDLGKQVEADFSELLDTLFPEENEDNTDNLRALHFDYARIEAKNYLPDRRLISQIDRFLSGEVVDGKEDTDNSRLHIIGDSGSGKSALLSYITTRENENERFYIVPYFAGAGEQIDAASLAERIKSECEAAGENQRVLVIIDDASAITGADSNADTSWLSAIPQDALLIVSSATNQPVTELLRRDIASQLSVMPLLLSQQRNLAESYFKAYRKRLTEKDYQLVVHPSKLFDNTLAYVTLLEELRCFGSFDRLPEYIATITSFTTAESFYNFLLDSKERFYATERHPEVVRIIMSLLVLSAGGLTESDLVAISGIPQMLVSQFLLGNTYLVKRHNGLLKVAHNKIASVVTEKYALDTEEGADELRSAIIDYFESEGADERLKDIELPYQYWQMGLLDDLYLYISDYDYLKRCLSGNRHFFLRYWQTLLHHDPWMYRVDAYFDSTPDLPFSEDNEILAAMGRDYFAELYMSIRNTNLLNFTHLLLVFLNTSQPIEMMCCRALNTLSKDQTELREPWLSMLATIYGRRGEFAKALQLFSTTLESLQNKDMEYTHTLLSNIAENYLTIGDMTHKKHYYEIAAKIQKEVLEYRIKRYGRLHRDVAVSLSNLASSLHEIGRHDEANRMLAESTEIYRQLSGDVDIDVAINLSNECNLALETGNYEKALSLSRRLIEIVEALPVPDSLHLIDAYTQQLKALVRLDRKEEIPEVIEKCLEYVRPMPNNLQKIQKLLYLTELGRQVDAGRALDKLRTALLETTSLNDDAVAYNLRGKALGLLNMTQEAISDYDNAISLYIAQGRYQDAASAAGAAAAMLSLGMQFEAATEWFERSFDIMEEYDVDPTGQTGILWQNYAVTLYNMRRAEDAIVAMRNACDIRQTLFGDDDEMLTHQYIPLLQKMEAAVNTLPLTEMPTTTYQKDIELFKTLIGNDEEAIEDFSLAMSYFSRGGMSHAVSLFKMLLAGLDAKGAPIGAIAWVKRSLAYGYEMEKTESSLEKALKYYEEALEDALQTDNYRLQEAVAHDYAEFCWNQEKYSEALRIYTYQWAGAVGEVGFFDQRSMRCVGNMAAAMTKCGEDTDLSFVLHCGSLLIVLGHSSEDNEITEWGSSLVGNALTALGISFDKYQINPVTSLAKVMNFFLNKGLIIGAAAAQKLYHALGYRISQPEDELDDEEEYNKYIILSVRDSFYKLYLDARLANAVNLPYATEVIAYAIEYMNSYEEEIATERESDQLYELLAKACIKCCNYPMALNCFTEVRQYSESAADDVIKCVFMDNNMEMAEGILNLLENSHNPLKVSPLSVILLKLVCGIDIDNEEISYLSKIDVKEEPTVNLAFILLALNRTGMVDTAGKFYREVTEESYNNPHQELQRLFAICAYLKDNDLMEEVEVYKKYASKLIEQLEDYEQHLFAEAFED